MNGDAARGKRFSLIIGLYLVCKQLLNLILGFSASNVLMLLAAAAACWALYAGMKHMNTVVATLIVLNACICLPDNLRGLGLNIYLLYTLEGLADVVCGFALVLQQDVKAYFAK